MSRQLKKAWSVALLALCAATLNACTTVFETYSQDSEAGLACRTTAGAYYLPKVLMRLAVVQNDGLGRGFKLKSAPEFIYVADRRHQPYCLDYLASPTAKDLITVEQYTTADGAATGLLKTIYSNAEDRSDKIAVKLIQTGEFLAQAALRRRMLSAAGVGETADLTFDPFDPVEMTEINRALRRFGFCVYIENHSFPETVNPQAWCSDSAQERYVNEYNVMLATTPALPDAMNTGILYRPNATHKLIIRRKSDPTGREPWALFMTKHIEAPNVSPIFSIGVLRSLFATRETSLTFASGVLTNVKISKTSELEAISTVALRAAQAIVNVPTQIVQLRINDVTDQTTLANSQADLIAQLAQLNSTQAANPQAAAAAQALTRSGAVPDRNQQVMEYCLQQGSSPDYCRSRVLGLPR